MSKIAKASIQANEDRGIDILYEWADECFKAGRFEEVDKELAEADLAELSTTIIVTLLTVSSWAKSKLSNRSSFVAKSREVLESRRANVKSLEQLLTT